jgi:hypothetical protein
MSDGENVCQGDTWLCSRDLEPLDATSVFSEIFHLYGMNCFIAFPIGLSYKLDPKSGLCLNAFVLLSKQGAILTFS